MDSMQTSWQLLLISHRLNSRIELLKVEKRFFWSRRFDTTSGFDDGGNEKRFVNIDTTTGLVSNFHSQTPFVKDKKPLTELPHN